VDPRAGLDDMEKRRILPHPGIEHRPCSLEPVAVPIELSRIFIIKPDMLIY
jgi:hypothetical protein